MIVRIGIPEEVPGGSGPLRHGICFPFCGRTAFRADAVHKGVDLGKRAFSAFTGCKILHFRQLQRELIIRYADHTAVRAVNDRDRLAPIPLPVECPVLHLVLYTGLADAFFLEERRHFRDGFLLGRDTVQKSGVDHLAVAGIRFFFDVAAFDDLNDVNAELLCEIVVALIVCRYRHDRTGAVAHHHVVGDVDRDFPAICRIDRRQPLNAHAGLILYELCPLKFRFLRAFFTIGVKRVCIGDLISVFIEDRMLRCNDHEGHAEHGIRTRGVDAQRIVTAGDLEIDKRTLGTTDPVLLLETDVRQIIDVV